MGITERKERQRRAVAEGILAAARAIAAAEGWPAVTIRKIAARIEYSPPAIYEYFDSKEAILLALMRRGYAEQRAAIERAARAAGSPEAALGAIGHAYLDFAIGAPDLYRVMYDLGGVALPAAETRNEGEKTAAVVGATIAAILRGQGRGEDDIMGKVTLMWGTIHGLTALLLAGRLPGGREEAARLTEQAVCNALAAWRGG